MIRSWRFLAITAVFLAAAVWGVAPTVHAAQRTVVVELNFETSAGEAPNGELAVLDVATGIEYRNDRVAEGGSIAVNAVPGVESSLLVRRTDLSPSAVTCEGEGSSARVAGSRILVTTGDRGAVCTVTLSNELPMTGASPASVMVGTVLLGLGTLAVGMARSSDPVAG